jgi:hypothetical protein
MFVIMNYYKEFLAGIDNDICQFTTNFAKAMVFNSEQEAQAMLDNNEIEDTNLTIESL